MVRQLYFQMIVGLVAGTLLGHFWPEAGVALGPLGIAFIKTMRMMVPPILFCTIVDAIVLHGGAVRTGSTIARAVALFFVITALGLLSGTVAAEILHPGAGLDLRAIPASEDLHRQFAVVPIRSPGDFLLRMVPETFFSAFTAGDVLPVLFIAALVGFGLVRIRPDGEPITRAVRALTRLQFAIFGFLIRLSPLGAFGAVAYTVGTYGIGFIGSLGLLVGTLALGCAMLATGLLTTLKLATGLKLLRLARYFRDEFVIVIGTSSSEVVLPRLIVKLEALGAGSAVVGLVVPLGYTLNLAGTAVYLSVATLFLSEALGIPLPPERIALYLAVMLLTSKTAVGVAGSGFSALLVTLTLMPDIPVGAAAMLIAVDKLLSILRAVTSGLANITSTLLIAHWEGAQIRLEMPLPTPRSAD